MTNIVGPFLRRVIGENPALFRRPVLINTFENLPDDGLRKAARGEKTCLLRAILRRFGQLAELLAPDGLSAGEFGFAQLGAHLFDQLLANRMTFEFVDDAACAHARRAPM